MWYIFPQLEGLGRSHTAQLYAVKTLDEAREYLAHPLLGRRLAECASAVLSIQDRTARQIFGSPDDVKLRSSMTLFALVSTPDSVFHRVIDKYFNGQQDPLTLNLLPLGNGSR